MHPKIHDAIEDALVGFDVNIKCQRVAIIEMRMKLTVSINLLKMTIYCS